MVDFSSNEDLDRWLEDKPRDVAIMIAARTALRALHALSQVPELRKADTSNLVLCVLRATAASWVGAKYPARSSEIGDICASASTAVSSAFAHLPLYAQTTASTSAEAAFAVTPDADAVSAATRAISNAAIVSASTFVLNAASADASAIEEGVSPALVASRPLWPSGQSGLARHEWTILKDRLLELDRNWKVWTDWYQARQEGRPANETLEVARVLIAEEIWREGPKEVNAEIRRLIEEHKAVEEHEVFESAFAEDVQDARITPKVPHQRPAAIEPIWVKGRLTIPTKPAKADLNNKKFEAALSALRAELRELVDDVSAEANIDKRPAVFLRRLVERIPETMPQQDELFRLGHVEAIFAGYAKTVDQEWPDFLASRYHAVALQFDRTLRQVPLWREFKRNAAKETLSAAQIADSTALAREAASALQQGEAATFVDPAISQSLVQLADALPVAKAGEEQPPDAIEAGKELLAADLVESVNNTLKPIAEVALAAARDYVKGAGKGFAKAAKKQGPIDGEKAFKWLRRLAIGGGAGAGSFVALSNLIAKFPEAFAWLERVLHFLK